MTATRMAGACRRHLGACLSEPAGPHPATVRAGGVIALQASDELRRYLPTRPARRGAHDVGGRPRARPGRCGHAENTVQGADRVDEAPSSQSETAWEISQRTKWGPRACHPQALPVHLPQWWHLCPGIQHYPPLSTRLSALKPHLL